MSPVLFAVEGWDWLERLLQETDKTIILCDSNTRTCLDHLKSHCAVITELPVIEITAGETHKNLETCSRVWHELTEYGADRHTVLLNLGGGVVTDLGGFVAATYMRGIRCVHIPTSLMGMVDAAIGGKTGVDLGFIKNRIGLFSQSEAVIIDSGFLQTLPERELNNGMAEVLKHAFIADTSILDRLDNVDMVIEQSVKVKSRIVEADELEQGERKKLNFGHTIGHATESHYLSTEHPLSHGEAVATGMIMAAFISHRISGLPSSELDTILKAVDGIFQRVEMSDVAWGSVKKFMGHDKKNRHGKLQFVLIPKLGEAVTDQEVSEELLNEAFAFYTSDS